MLVVFFSLCYLTINFLLLLALTPLTPKSIVLPFSSFCILSFLFSLNRAASVWTGFWIGAFSAITNVITRTMSWDRRCSKQRKVSRVNPLLPQLCQRVTYIYILLLPSFFCLYCGRCLLSEFFAPVLTFDWRDCHLTFSFTTFCVESMENAWNVKDD